MTTYRILPDGRRRTLPDGTPRTVALPGPAGSAATADIAAMVFSGAATAVLAAALTLAPADTVFAGQAQISFEQVGQTAQGEMAFGGSASITAFAGATASASTVFQAQASGSVPALAIPASATTTFGGSGELSALSDLLLETADTVFGGSATGSMAATASLWIATTTFTGSARVSLSTAEQWRSIWLNVYAARQAVLNAIDANNRFLAKQAGVQAKATADALVITDTRVTEINDRVTAEALRTTLLSASIPGAGGNLVKSTDFSSGIGGWTDALVGTAPTSGAGAQGATTFKGPYLRPSAAGSAAYEQFFPVTPGEVLERSANLYAPSGTGLFGIHYVDAQGTSSFDTELGTSAPGSWQRVSGLSTVPPNVNMARAMLWNPSGLVWMTMPDIRRRGVSAGANASALQSMQATVSQQGENISANSQAITAANAAIAGKASAEAVSTLTARTDIIDGKVTSQTQAITAVNAAIEGKASAEAVSTLTARTDVIDGKVTAQGQAITAVEGAAGNAASTAATALTAANDAASAATNVSLRIGQSPDNLVKQSTFSTGSLGQWSGTSIIGVGPSSIPGGGETAVMRVTTSGSYETGNEFPAAAGEQFDVSFVSNGNARVGLHFMSTTGATTGWEGPSRSSAGFAETTGRIVAPPGTNKARPWSTANAGTADLTRVRIERVSTGVKQLAAVTQELRTNIDATTGRLNATHGVVLTVDGKISGTRSENDGTRSSFDVLADVFRVTGSPVEGMEWQAGYLRVYGPAYQRIIGTNFGAASEGLVDYFGPNVGAANATRANGLFWLAKDGTGYFAGTVLQGVLRAFGSTTEVSPGAEVYTGVVSSKNTQVAITGRLRYSANQSYPAHASKVTLTNGTTAANVVLERRYRNANDTGWDGGWVALATDTIIGMATVQNETDGPSFVNWNIGGEVLATDVASARKREYRLRLTNLTRQNHTVTNPGNIPALVQNQYQSIESLE